ncbi:MAG: carbohydrate ABC transporter permease, partial [Candidatus Xenobia bacterium]
MTLTRRMAFAFLVPAGLLLLAFLVVPAIWSLLQGFTNFTLLGPEARHLQVTGTVNYVRALRDPGFWNSLRASLLYVAGSAVIGQVGCGLILALLTFKNGGPLAGFVRGVAVTAWIVPTIVVAILWNVFLHAQGGTLNRMLGVHVDWLTVAPMLSLVLFNTWRGSAFSMLLFDAALRTIPA